MAFLGKLLLGTGELKPEVRAALESEGLVAIEQGLPGAVRYRRCKAPGRRFHGKVTLERIGFAISEQRLVMYCRSGRAKLIDASFSNLRRGGIEVSLRDDDTVSIRIDYDELDIPDVSGKIAITATTPNAADIVRNLQARLGP